MRYLKLTMKFEKIKNTGPGLPAPTSLQITGCATSPCNVNRGALMTYSVGFTPSKDILESLLKESVV